MAGTIVTEGKGIIGVHGSRFAALAAVGTLMDAIILVVVDP